MGNRADEDLERMKREVTEAGLVPFSPAGIGPLPTAEREIAALERIMRAADFTPEQIAERVGFWRRHIAVQFAIDNTRLEGGSVSPETRPA